MTDQPDKLQSCEPSDSRLSQAAKKEPVPAVSRRDILKSLLRGAFGLAIAGAAAALVSRRASAGERLVWQIDPAKCTQCGRCRVNCVLEPSAVKCVHAFALCGYCNLCTGFLLPEHLDRDTAAENEVCPTDAITRRFVEDPHYEYTIDENRCVGCGKCVKGCGSFGNGSLFLQVRHDRCLNCNQCSIAAACPAQAYVRVPASHPYLLKGQEKKT
jgi:electron transport complex protein RnfB